MDTLGYLMGGVWGEGNGGRFRWHCQLLVNSMCVYSNAKHENQMSKIC
jgi:hypothetical protein